jgi:hypothetical protein
MFFTGDPRALARSNPFASTAQFSSCSPPAPSRLITIVATDAGNSTFDALIHTQLDVSVGLTLGAQVGQQVVAHAQTDGAN